MDKKCKTCGKKITRRTFCSKICYGESRRGSGVDKEKLIELYVNKKIEVNDISKILNFSVNSIFKAIHYYDIPLRGQHIDWLNKEVGNVTIIKRLKSKKGKHERWLCKCMCGEKFETSSSSFSQCSKNYECKDCRWKRRRSKEEITDFIWGQIKGGSKSRAKQLDFEISKEYAYGLFLDQNRKCKLSNVDIVFASTAREHKKGGSTASLDRIDSSKGYIEGNVQWVHKRVNIMKMSMSDEELINWCKKIVNHTTFN